MRVKAGVLFGNRKNLYIVPRQFFDRPVEPDAVIYDLTEIHVVGIGFHRPRFQRSRQRLQIFIRQIAPFKFEIGIVADLEGFGGYRRFEKVMHPVGRQIQFQLNVFSVFLDFRRKIVLGIQPAVGKIQCFHGIVVGVVLNRRQMNLLRCRTGNDDLSDLFSPFARQFGKIDRADPYQAFQILITIKIAVFRPVFIIRFFTAFFIIRGDFRMQTVGDVFKFARVYLFWLIVTQHNQILHGGGIVRIRRFFQILHDFFGIFLYRAGNRFAQIVVVWLRFDKTGKKKKRNQKSE